MLIDGFPAAAFETNCWVLAAQGSDECLVVDPGIDEPDVRQTLNELLARRGLAPVAVLATHGHLDHTFSIRPVCHERGIPAYIHSDDRAALVDPARLSGPALSAMFSGREFLEPDDVRLVSDGDELSIAGLTITVDHAPGHTPGSVLFRVESEGVLISGDVLFAGSIGRTDLPGGSLVQMAESLRGKVAVLHDDYRVLPGHGPTTQIGLERMNNPYLIAAMEGRL
jgi:hydroxyacylglutathione hydrolase